MKKIIAAPILVITSYLLFQSTNRFIDHSCSKVPLVKPTVQGEIAGKRIMPTQIFFDDVNKHKVISDFANSRFVYADYQENNWREFNKTSLGRVHAITYHRDTSRYFAVDTSNNSVISFTNLDKPDSEFSSFKTIGGISVGIRPHDIAYNDKDGFVYVLLNSGLLRFKPTDVKDKFENVAHLSKAEIQAQLQARVIDKTIAIGYMRALSIIDGEIFLVNSTLGNVVKITQFESPDSWKIYFNTARNRKYAEKGSFDQHGLILNDVKYFNGWWYASNYYVTEASNYLSDQSISKFKMIRWKNWDDFKNSNWQDLSVYVHPESIPYYFSEHGGKLFVAMFHAGNKAGVGSGIFEISPSKFCIFQ